MCLECFLLTPWFVLIFLWLSVNGHLTMFLLFPSNLLGPYTWLQYVHELSMLWQYLTAFLITYHIMDSLKFLHKIYGIISANHSCCIQYAYLIFTDSIYEKLLPNLAPMFALFMYCFLDAHQFHFYPASDIITAGDFVITVFFFFLRSICLQSLDWVENGWNSYFDEPCCTNQIYWIRVLLSFHKI